MDILLPPPRLPIPPDQRLAEAVAAYGPEDGPMVLQQMPGALDMEIVHGVQYPHPSLEFSYESGTAEPWTSQIVYSLLVASNQRNVLDTGAFVGYTSAWMAMALEKVGGGTLTAVDIERERLDAATQRLAGLPLTRVQTNVVHSDILQYIPSVPDQSIGFAWVDDCHEAPHVATEINLLWRKMKPKGIITFHDVWGSFDLKRVVRHFGGYCIDLPRLGAAGGVGIIQIPE